LTLNAAGIEWSYDEYPTVIQINISIKNKELIEVLSGAGFNAPTKRLPSVVFKWDKKSVMSLLRGLYDADGSYDEEEKLYKFNTVSQILANDVLLMLRSIGYFPTCYIYRRAGESIIEGRPVNIRDRYEVHYYTDPTKSRFCEYDKELDVVWTTVRDTDKESPYKVYNLTVEDEHTFIANNIIVHNCGGDGNMISVDPRGDIFPCIRFMKSSLGETIEPIKIGNVYDGISTTEDEQKREDSVTVITRRSQSNDICYECPIGEGCAWCFRAGTLITTENGSTPIEKIQVGDMVLSKDNKLHEVTNTMKRLAENPVYLKAQGTPVIFTTAEHPFWIRKYLGVGTKGDVRGKLIYSEPNWIKAKDINISDKVCLNIPKFGTTSIDPNVAYMVGRWLGDGWLTLRRSHNNKYYPSYYICCAYDEISELESKMIDAKIEFSKDNTKRTAQEYLLLSKSSESSNNKQFLNIIRDCGKYAHGKKISNYIFGWDEKSIINLLAGYLEADGYMQEDKHKIRFSSVSKELAWGISTLLRMIGRNPSWCEQSSKPMHHINGRIIRCKKSYNLSFKYEKYIREYSKFDHVNNVVWSSVTNKGIPEEHYEVYNISVKDNPTYYADGVLVHNCTGLNYQLFGTPDKRSTFNCVMHIATSLANTYHWNNIFLEYDEKYLFKRYVPDEWALKIIDSNELNLIDNLEAKLISKLDDIN
jgi:radical SAM protein with 4Fe4S-binding SPASM domain